MRRIESVTLVLLASFLGLVMFGCESIQNAIYEAAIEKAIHEDALTGHAPTFDHTNAMRRVDLSGCPQDFREAYSKHIHAWEEVAAVQQARTKLNDEEDAAAVAGVLATIFGSDATPWGDHVQAVQEVNRLEAVARGDVATTWQEVEDVARKYGVQM